MIIKLGEDCEMDLDKLISTRMLINANSGAGKSWLGRRMMEQCANKVQQIIIDLEGEFVSLREEYDFMIVGKGGDIPMSLKSAELLAIKLLELKVSAVVDLSELKKHERSLFVKRFLDSLMDSPSNLWHPLIVYVDEAHQFAPEGKSGKAESKSSMIDLGTRGRKRGFCGVFMTQRISKLDKDLAAELNNQMTGRTTLDIDRKRAADNLGLTSKAEERSLRELPDGVFHAFGPAFKHTGILKMKVGGVKTTHQDRTKGIIAKPTKTPDNIKKILKDVINLPEEAEAELKTKEELGAKIKELKRQIRILEHSKPKPEVDQELMSKMVERARLEGFNEATKKGQGMSAGYEKIIKDYQRKGHKVIELFGGKADKMPEWNLDKIKPQPHIKKEHHINIPEPKPIVRVAVPREEPDIHGYPEDNDFKLGLCEKKLYTLFYEYSERSFTKPQVGVFTGYSYKSGGFGNAISRLRKLNLIKGSGDNLQISDVRQDLIGSFDFSKEAIIGKLRKCEKEIYEVLLEQPYEEFSKEDLASATPTNYSPGSGGFSNALSRLRTLGLAERNNGAIKLNPELLEL